MVAKPETLNRFIFNSDYPTDKIIWLYEGQFTTPSTGTTVTNYIDVPSMIGSSQPLFIKGAYTLDSWATSAMIGTYPLNDVSKAINTSLTWETTNGGRLGLGVSSGNSAAVGKTAKYRLWGVQRDDIDFAIDYAKNNTVSKSKLMFNSENNYPRIYKEGVAMTGDTIQHNLGRIPYVDFWYIPKVNSSVTPDTLLKQWWYQPIGELKTGANTNATVKATDSTVTFGKWNSTYDVYYYYRIYA